MPERARSAARRRRVAERAGGRCEYCLSPAEFTPDPFVLEHIVPQVLGGRTHLANLAYSCHGCNNHKYAHIEAIDPVSGETVPLYHPRRHRRADHFTWSEDSTRIVGRTPIGRATVERLQLNRAGVVNLRWLLRVVGRHPPSM